MTAIITPRDRFDGAPLVARLGYATALAMMQNLLLRPVSLGVSAGQYLFPTENKPDLVKTYPCRPRLPVRIFFPPSHAPKAGDPSRPGAPIPVPVLFTIHGGGFILGSPSDGHHLERAYARDHGFLVISLDYSWAPAAPFPGPVHDIAALIAACLADAALPLDPARASVMGWSAGANLALAASQLPQLRGCIRAVVPIYPVVDWTTRAPQKLLRRRWKPALGGFRGRNTDYLMLMAPVSEWAYLTAGQDVRDPLLSPFFAPRDGLPGNVFVVAAEMDLLADEGWRMACKLAGREVPGGTVGREEVAPEGELVLDDERFYFEERADGKRTGWLLVPDVVHGFDMKIEPLVRDAATMEDGKKKTAKLVQLLATWLKEVNDETGVNGESRLLGGRSRL